MNKKVVLVDTDIALAADVRVLQKEIGRMRSTGC